MFTANWWPRPTSSQREKMWISGALFFFCLYEDKPLVASPPPQSLITAEPLPSPVRKATNFVWMRLATGHYVTAKKGSTAQRSRCLLCENTPVAWPDPDNEWAIMQLCRPQRRPMGQSELVREVLHEGPGLSNRSGRFLAWDTHTKQHLWIRIATTNHNVNRGQQKQAYYTRQEFFLL